MRSRGVAFARGLLSVCSRGSCLLLGLGQKRRKCGSNSTMASPSSQQQQQLSELRATFRSGKTRPVEWRVKQLKALLLLVEEREEEIVKALSLDIGKPAHETYVSELSFTKQACRTALKNVRSWMAPEKVSTSLVSFPASGEIVSEPLGVALIISAWNFPLLLALDPVVGAVAAGNCVVLKPSELAPATSALLAKYVPQYLDEAAVRVVEGGVPETTLLLEQQWDIILYTGSTRVGKIVMAAAAKYLTPVVLELGGKSPVLVDSTTDLKVTARRIAFGKWATNNAQACVSPDYILAEKSVVPKLIESLRESLTEFYGNDPSTSQDLSRIVNESHFSRLEALLEEDGVKQNIVHGGERDRSRLYIAPTIVVDPPATSQIMCEEIFGPLLPILSVSSMDSAISFVNERPKPLALYLFTTDETLQSKVVQETSAGGMVVNDTILHFANETMPFGGVGASGMGSYHGKFSFQSFSHKKGVLYRKLWGDMSVRYPPYTTKKRKLLRSVLERDFVGVFKTLIS